MTIKQSIYAGFVFFLVVVGINSWIGYRAIEQLGNKLDYISGPAWNAADGAMEGQIGLESQIIVLQKVYHKEMTTQEAKPILNDAIAMEEEALGRMKGSNLIADKTVSELDNFLKVFHHTRDSLWRQFESGNSAEREYKDLNSQVTNLLSFISKMEEEADSKVENETKNIESLRVNSERVILTVLILGTLASFIFIFLAKKIVLAPLYSITENLQNLSTGTGDLTVTLPNANIKTEMGQLAFYFNEFVQRLRGLIRQVQSSNESLFDASSKISNFITRSATGSSIQLEEISRVAESINKITTALERVGQSANEANQSSEKAVTTTHAGNNTVISAQQGVDDIVTEVENASSVIAALVADSQNISSMLEVIRSIAEQTNLLALNAAIEAARAGESGRGFAVVADEVRSLASRTQESTKAIEEIISNLNNGSGRAVTVMHDAQNKALAIKERISKTSDSFAHIVSVVEQIKSMNAQIATASEDEKGDMHMIRNSMNTILELARRNREVGDDASQSRIYLDDEVKKINALMQQFRT